MKNIAIYICLGVLGGAFFGINENNYKKYREIQKTYIEHPEMLPKKELLKYSSAGFQNLRADLYWIQAIQYIGRNVIHSEYKQYLYYMLDIITELNPYFESPYIIGQLLIPSYNHRYEDLNDNQKNLHINQGLELGKKGVENFCDQDIMDKIKKENNLETIWTEEAFKNPCKTYSIPYYLAFIHHYYKKDPLSASQYYKIASANEDSLEGAKIMVGIMESKGGQRKKSYFMFLNVAKYIEKENKICSEFSTELEKIGTYIFPGDTININTQLLQAIQKQKDILFGKFEKETEEKHLGDTQCLNYVNKAMRELNLTYLDAASNKYKQDHPQSRGVQAKGLLEKGYIDFIPLDFQQYEDQKQGIFYNYDYDLGYFGYVMRNYNEW